MDINLIIQQAVEEVLKQVGAAGCAAGADNGDLSPASMAKYLDDTLLKADATIEQIKAVCDEAKQYHCARVCVNTGYIAYVAEQLSGSGVTPCCVIGFPLGAMTSEAKAAETRDAIQKGAREVDMVINLSLIHILLFPPQKRSKAYWKARRFPNRREQPPCGISPTNTIRPSRS